MPPPAQEERWAILAAIPCVAESKKTKRIFPAGADFSMARNELPRASVLTVPPHISLPPCLGVYPYVAAADCSGLLLLCGTHPISSNSVMVSYHICDASTGQAVSLPEPPRAMAFYSATIGLIVKGDGGCMVAGLQSEGDGGGAATLLSYKVGDGCRKWRERALTAGSPPLPRDWFPESVVSHGGMLWWVDLSYGLLACDPFDEEPRLLHVPLPQVPDEIPPNSRVNRGTRSCVKVCGGRLRYVQIHGDIEVPVVSTWVLIASTWCPGRWEWSPEHSVPLAEVWVDETYLNTKLPLSIPAIAFLHPTNPDRVYFFLRSCIFAVDLQLKKVVEFNQFEMLDPPGEIGRKRSSRYVHAWQYDPSSTRSDFVSTCLRQEKVIPTRRSFSGFSPAMPATAKMMKRVWNTIAMDRRRQQEEWRQRAMSGDFKRRCGISEGSRISLESG